MKAKKIIPTNAVKPQAVDTPPSSIRTKRRPALPDPPYIPQDINFPVPAISQAEITAYMDAKLAFLSVRADYIRRRADLTLKLLQHCLPEPGSHLIRLEDGGEKLTVLDHCSCCHSSTEEYERCQVCHSWAS
jgi:hypothetical protein